MRRARPAAQPRVAPRASAAGSRRGAESATVAPRAVNASASAGARSLAPSGIRPRTRPSPSLGDHRGRLGGRGPAAGAAAPGLQRAHNAIAPASSSNPSRRACASSASVSLGALKASAIRAHAVEPSASPLASSCISAVTAAAAAARLEPRAPVGEVPRARDRRHAATMPTTWWPIRTGTASAIGAGGEAAASPRSRPRRGRRSRARLGRGERTRRPDHRLAERRNRDRHRTARAPSTRSGDALQVVAGDGAGDDRQRCGPGGGRCPPPDPARLCVACQAAGRAACSAAPGRSAPRVGHAVVGAGAWPALPGEPWHPARVSQRGHVGRDRPRGRARRYRRSPCSPRTSATG